VRPYYQLTKPGIIYGNALTAVAGFMLAAQGHSRIGLFLAMIVGLSCIIGASCVYNNYIDRDIDQHMKRTRKRALVAGTITATQALTFATVLAFAGIGLLGFFTNGLTLLIALFGMFAYIALYGIGKRKTVHGTLIGSLSGALPPVVGYVAVTGHLDVAAALLFIILIFWQMPHFYAIALFRAEDYRAAGIPVLPVVSGARITKIQVMIYVAGFAAASSLLTYYGYAGYSYLSVMLLVSLVWLWRGIRIYNSTDSVTWGRSMFFFSLIVILVWSITVQ
jgi:protoheme IX farnesyltransferase